VSLPFFFLFFFLSFLSVSKFTLEPRYYPKATSKRQVNSLKEAPKGRGSCKQIFQKYNGALTQVSFQVLFIVDTFLLKQWSASRMWYVSKSTI
jgi:hypothetical protein